MSHERPIEYKSPVDSYRAQFIEVLTATPDLKTLSNTELSTMLELYVDVLEDMNGIVLKVLAEMDERGIEDVPE